MEWRPSETLRASLAVDYFEDDYGTSYWGSPLVPASVAQQPTNLVHDARNWVFDEALRDTNYNVTDGLMTSEQLWIRGNVQWQISDAWSVNGQLFHYDAERQWTNAETYISGGTSTTLNRGLVSIGHDHGFYGGRATVGHQAKLGSMHSRFIAGVEYSDTDFTSPRRFSDGSASTNAALQVDAFNPVRGAYNADPALFTGGGNRTDFNTGIKVLALFAEEALNITDTFVMLGGIRRESIDLDRSVYDLNNVTFAAFAREYNPTSWRIGAVYDIAPTVQVFAQYNKAVAPVSTILLMSATNSRFALSTGVSYEVGVKATLFDGRLDATTSVYRITQDEILTRDPNNANITIQGGEQSSRGVEFSLSVAATDNLRVEGNLALLQAQFDQLIEAGGVSRNGNRPPNVSTQQANLWGYYKLAGLPLTFGVGAHHAGSFFTNNANTIRVDGYNTFDTSLTYKLKNMDITLRGRNLTDELYADWTGASANQIILAAPRNYELSLYTRF